MRSSPQFKTVKLLFEPLELLNAFFHMADFCALKHFYSAEVKWT